MRDGESVSELLARGSIAELDDDVLEGVAAAVAAVDGEGRVLRWNGGAERLLGWRREELIGSSGATLPADAEALAQVLAIREALLGGAEWSGTLRVRTRDGGVATVRVRARPVTADHGDVVAVLTAIGEAEGPREDDPGVPRALPVDEPTLPAGLLDDAPIGFALLDPDLRYVHVNHALAEISGVPAEQHLARAVRDVLPGIGASVEPELRRVLESGTTPRTFSVRGETPGDPGRRRSWLVHAYPTHDAVGSVTGLAAVVVDVTDSRRTEDALRLSEERLRTALDAAGMATWDWDLESGQVVWTGSHERILDAAEGAADARYEALLARVHPDDRGRVAAAVERAVADCGRFEEEFRVVADDGALHWVAGRGRALAEDEGPARRMVGTLVEVTARRVAEDQERSARDRLARTLERITDAFLALDADARFTYLNGQAEALLGRDRDELLGRRLWDVFPTLVGSRSWREYRRAVEEQTTVEFVDRLLPGDRWVEIRMYPGYDGLSVYLRDVTDRRRQERERAALWARQRRAQEALVRVVETAPTFHLGGTPDEVKTAVCRAACDAFGAQAASLWAAEDDGLVLTARAPDTPLLPNGSRYDACELPEVVEALRSLRPSFVPDASSTESPVFERSRLLGARSLLRIPIVVERTLHHVLILVWDRVVPEPSAELLAVAQRFADQAGLALEQAGRREAQREVRQLNETIESILAMGPRFQAGGSTRSTARAVCVAARDAFAADAASVWVAEDGTYRLLARVPSDASRPNDMRVENAGVTFSIDPLRRELVYVDDIEQRDPEAWRRYGRAVGVHAQLLLPLTGGGRVDAVLAVTWKTPRPDPGPAFRAVAQRFADQAATALAEAQRRQAQDEARRLYAQFEETLLPPIRLRDPAIRVASRYLPGEHRMRLGGDFFDALEQRDGGVSLLIGDVAGHGPASAALGAHLRAAWRALVLSGAGPGEALAGLDRLLQAEASAAEAFATVCSCTVSTDRRTLTVALAGHPAPLLLGAPDLSTATVQPPLGVVPDYRWSEVGVALPPAATLVLYTDGVVEGRDAPQGRGRYGVSRLRARLEAGLAANLSGRSLLDAVLADARAAHGGDLPDDVALLVLAVDAAR